MKGKRFKFSKAGILAMPLPSSGNQVLYPDPEQAFHFVRVTAGGSRSFVCDKNTKRGRIRITLGPAGTDALTAVRSREQAQIVLGMIAEGLGADQIKDRLARVDDRIPVGAVTLEQVLELYLAERKHKLSVRTVSDYRALMSTHLSDWRHRPMEAIDASAVTAKFTSIDSPSRANYAFRLVRALFNYAKSIKDDDDKPIVQSNPVEVLSQRRIWHDQAPKREVISLSGLPAWWKTVSALATPIGTRHTEAGHFAKGTSSANSNGETVRDFLQFLILTGLRRNEAATLKWEDTDLPDKKFTVAGTIAKNKEAHVLPLSDFLYSLLKRRHAVMLKEREAHLGDAAHLKRAAYVFSGEKGSLAEPKKQIAKVVTASGVHFSSHTLRRTFATAAEQLDIPYLALKRLLNHKAQDVTGRSYTVIGVERLREPMQKITNFILREAKVKTRAKKIAQVHDLQRHCAA
jgi:integrase